MSARLRGGIRIGYSEGQMDRINSTKSLSLYYCPGTAVYSGLEVRILNAASNPFPDNTAESLLETAVPLCEVYKDRHKICLLPGDVRLEFHP